MSLPDRILSLDLGTSSLKGLVVDASGRILAEAARSYAMHSPQPGYAEQDPYELRRAAEAVLAELEADELDLVLGSAMHGLLGLDGAGEPIGPLWTWADQRAAAVAQELRGSEAAEGLHRRTGTPLHPMAPLCKLRYWRQENPRTFARVQRFVGIKEYLCQALFGIEAVDHAVASATGLLDVATRTWDPQALELAGITAARLPPLRPCDAVYDLGGRRLVLGATDGLLANLGMGLRGGPEICLTLGTSAAARKTLTAPQTDPAGRLFCYAFEADTWVRGGAINDCGLVLRYLVERFAPADWDLRRALREVAAVPPGAGGLRFVPGLSGFRYPSYDQGPGAGLQGLRLEHGPAEIVAAGLEAVLQSLVPLVDELAGGAAAIRAGGGLLGDGSCAQRLADVLGREVQVADSPQSSALGGAVLGFEALGVSVSWNTQTGRQFAPREQR